MHISTDEVFGSLGAEGLFCEDSPYAPNSPYSASKASSDHLVRAWRDTYGLPTILTNCSNNYGPYHFPEKLIPLTILNAVEGKPLPVYGRGENVRDWLYVEDHAAALLTVVAARRGRQCYNVGGRSERRNIEVVEAICDLLDEFAAEQRHGSRRELITSSPTDPATTCATRSTREDRAHSAGGRATALKSGCARPCSWYLDNPRWWRDIRSGAYRGERLGVAVRAADEVRRHGNRGRQADHAPSLRRRSRILFRGL